MGGLRLVLDARHPLVLVAESDIGFALGGVTWIADLATEQCATVVTAGSPIQTVEGLCSLGQPAKLSDTGLDSSSSITSSGPTPG